MCELTFNFEHPSHTSSSIPSLGNAIVFNPNYNLDSNLKHRSRSRVYGQSRAFLHTTLIFY